MLSRADIGGLPDLKGRRLMDTPDSDDFAAMLKSEGVDYKSLPRVQHNGDPRDFVSGKADAMVAHTTNEPFVLSQLDVPYQTFSPGLTGSTSTAITCARQHRRPRHIRTARAPF